MAAENRRLAFGSNPRRTCLAYMLVATELRAMSLTTHHTLEDLLAHQRAEIAWTLVLTAALGLALVLAG
jgi:hypothetical protein